MVCSYKLRVSFSAQFDNNNNSRPTLANQKMYCINRNIFHNFLLVGLKGTKKDHKSAVQMRLTSQETNFFFYDLLTVLSDFEKNKTKKKKYFLGST